MKEWIDYNELDYDEENRLNTYKGKPFSGIVYEKRKDGGWDEVMMVNGMENGISREWYSNGILKEESHMNNNYLHGITWEWNEQGQIMREAIYEFGTLVRQQRWNDQGVLISTYKIDENSSEYEFLQGHCKARRANFYSIPDV